jgi:hypothetical protein
MFLHAANVRIMLAVHEKNLYSDYFDLRLNGQKTRFFPFPFARYFWLVEK